MGSIACLNYYNEDVSVTRADKKIGDIVSLLHLLNTPCAQSCTSAQAVAVQCVSCPSAAGLSKIPTRGKGLCGRGMLLSQTCVPEEGVNRVILPGSEGGPRPERGAESEGVSGCTGGVPGVQ